MRYEFHADAVEEYVLILAVMHCHREPGYWRHRVKRRN
jgi:hypothetical protein